MKMNEFNYKPTPVFLGKGDWYVGIELEMEAPSSEAFERGLLLKENPGFCYAKHDGSISNGWELVTHPIPFHHFMGKPRRAMEVRQYFELVKQLQNMGYRSHDTSTCGMHIHICRKALGLGKMEEYYAPSMAFYYFRRIINSDLFFRISQRSRDEMEHWSAQMSMYNRPHRVPKNDRKYESINILKTTIEIRIFKGNMREDRIRKNVESVICALYWAKKKTLYDEDTSYDEQSFLEYVKENRKQYPNLYSFLIERKLCV